MIRRLMPALLLILSVVPSARSQEATPSAADMLQSYVDAARPVAEHDRLKTLAGEWDVTVRLWFDPDKPPMASSGTAKGRMILGGRFLQIDSTVGDPLPTEAMSILGFDRRTHHYTMVGYDTLGTYYITAAGKYSEAEKGVIFSGSYAQPPEGRDQRYRFVWKEEEPARHSLKLYFIMQGGGEALVAETIYTRGR